MSEPHPAMRLLRAGVPLSLLLDLADPAGPVASDGRPVERLPVGPGEGDSDTTATTEAPMVLAEAGTSQPHSLLPLILGGVLAALLLALLAWYLLSRRPVPVRLRLGAKALPRDYRLTPGQALALGGAPGAASGNADVFPLAGVTAPAALVKAERGGLSLMPSASGGDASPTLYHNGLRLEQPAPLRVGDELRVSVPATATDPEREHRIEVLDPHGPVF